MKHRAVVLLIMGVTVAASGACGNEARHNPATKRTAAPETASSPTSIATYEGRWKLVEGSGPEGEIQLKGWDVTGHIQEGRMFGDTGCNDYSLRIKIAGTTVSFGRGFVNEIGCPRSAPEEPYLAALYAATKIAREGERLVLTGPNAHLVFEPVSRPAVSEIVGHRWHLVKVFDGRRSAPAQPATLQFVQGGRFHGSTGCRQLSGSWIVEGDRITFTEMEAKGDCMRQIQEQDSFLINVLGDGFTADVSANKLTIFDSRSDDRLVYRKR